MGIIGAGSFAKEVHLPNLKRLNDFYEIKAICNKTGISTNTVAKKFSVKKRTSDPNALINDDEIDLVVICTRHNLHGNLVLKCLKSGKHVLVEKPLCTKQSELINIKNFFSSTKTCPLLMVGFNRRYSLVSTEIKEIINDRNGPLIINYQMNAGTFPIDHWIYNSEGGGRIVGEACHIVDLFSFFTESEVVEVSTSVLGGKRDIVGDEDICITIKYQDGSIGILTYFSKGSSFLSKERFEIHFDGKSILVDDYKKVKGFGINHERVYKISKKVFINY